MPAMPWDWENPIVAYERTGRCRHRIQKQSDRGFFRKARSDLIVLQVEDQEIRQRGRAHDETFGHRIFWRDARAEDFMHGPHMPTRIGES